MATGECLGNVVSDGRPVSSSGGLQNAQFGIRRDGTLVTGYLSEEEVLDTENPFVQLLSGVVWLIRNGTVYINQSQDIECEETQETALTCGTWLKQDVVNAINLDGGGSATFVLNGTLASYPSDHCQDNMWRCPRRVSTVVCLHEPRCQPPDCNGHGACVEGRCQCTGHFWRGASCSELDCGPSNCSQHGLCTETGCRCDAGWTGSNCSEECPLGWHGPGCQQPCMCEHQGPCDPQTGNCSFSRGEAKAASPVQVPGPLLAPVLELALELVESRFLPEVLTGRMEGGQAGLQSPAWRPPSSPDSGFSSASRTTWLALTLALAFLLLTSVAVNVSLLLGSRAERSRHLDGDYAYLPLQEMNGELLATEKGQPGDTSTPFKD
ncbi:N-acetylglucosamine-1-phosphodiester alpha-N-acetylglucosaminidase [Tupaia chinensis]|uniref:N-acetylglucosamine-1-phosphodiester alpha-N-acetylglucosaminidase n=1 Tax=Tupaia chinensis TaxID=246437 RepID=L9LBU1_TUPCH|nr:N-acetylglucosamine-1-phosphodiester alpha-N-acetylglucosaminidase [Tupaia chinensis]